MFFRHILLDDQWNYSVYKIKSTLKIDTIIFSAICEHSRELRVFILIRIIILSVNVIYIVKLTFFEDGHYSVHSLDYLGHRIRATKNIKIHMKLRLAHCGPDPGEIFFNILRLWSQMVVWTLKLCLNMIKWLKVCYKNLKNEFFSSGLKLKIPRFA